MADRLREELLVSIAQHDVQRAEEQTAAIEQAASEPVEEPVGAKASAAIAALPQEAITELVPGSNKVQQARNAQEAAADQRMRDRIKAERISDYGRLGTIQGSGLDNIEDRLNHGDAIVDNEGNVIGRRPVRLRDLTVLTGMVIDRKLAIEKRILGEGDGNPQSSMTPQVERLLVRLELVSRETPITGQVRGDYREPKVIDVTDDA